VQVVQDEVLESMRAVSDALAVLALDDEPVAVAVLLLDVVDRAEALQLPAEHDSQVVAQRLTLLHA